MARIESLKEALTSPLTALAVFLSTAAATIPSLGPVWDLVGATSSLWYPLIAVSGSTLLPQFGFRDLGTTVLVAGSLVFAVYHADRLVDRVAKWYENQ